MALLYHIYTSEENEEKKTKSHIFLIKFDGIIFTIVVQLYFFLILYSAIVLILQKKNECKDNFLSTNLFNPKYSKQKLNEY